jgi:CheY-like chemotaxis protein
MLVVVTHVKTSTTPRPELSIGVPGDAGSAAITTAILGLTRDPAVRDFLMEIAVERGYGLYCAADGPDALRVLAAEPPGLILVDVDLPDGRALVRTLRAEERWRGIPILGLTITNNPMMAVTLDLPVFFKPDLDGLSEALIGRFEAGGEAQALSAPVPPSV